MQTVSDSLLGWYTLPDQPGGTPKDYYVRQLWDGKGSFDLSVFNPDQLAELARMRGHAGARACTHRRPLCHRSVPGQVR